MVTATSTPNQPVSNPDFFGASLAKRNATFSCQSTPYAIRSPPSREPTPSPPKSRSIHRSPPNAAKTLFFQHFLRPVVSAPLDWVTRKRVPLASRISSARCTAARVRPISAGCTSLGRPFLVRLNTRAHPSAPGPDAANHTPVSAPGH